MRGPISQRVIGLGLRASGDTVAELILRLRKQGPAGDGRVVVAQADDLVQDAIRLFKSFDVHHLPVVHDGFVVGIVSATDLYEFFQSRHPEEAQRVTLGQIMTKEPRVIQKDAPAVEAISILANGSFHALPVLNPGGDIWDIITTRDLVRYLELLHKGEEQHVVQASH